MSTSPTSARWPRRRITAAVLSCLLGWLGVHKFYLGQNLWGIAYLLFATTGIPFFAGIIEGLIFFFMSDERFDERFNRPSFLDRKHPKVTAITLAVVAGGLGLHKFYLRQTIAGMIYLLATLFGAFLSFKAIQATGVFQNFAHMDELQMMEALEKLDRTQIPGLLLPSILMLIPTLGGFADALSYLLMKKERFEKEYGLKASDRQA